MRTDTVGRFLAQLLKRKRRFIRTASSTAALAAFLQGRTKEGTRPADVVDAMHRHPFGCMGGSKRRTVPAPPPPSPFYATSPFISSSAANPLRQHAIVTSPSRFGAYHRSFKPHSNLRFRIASKQSRRPFPEYEPPRGSLPPPRPPSSPTLSDTSIPESVEDVMSETESDIIDSSNNYSPRDSARAYCALEEWAVQRTLACVDREATGLTREPTLRNIADHVSRRHRGHDVGCPSPEVVGRISGWHG